MQYETVVFSETAQIHVIYKSVPEIADLTYLNSVPLHFAPCLLTRYFLSTGTESRYFLAIPTLNCKVQKLNLSQSCYYN